MESADYGRLVHFEDANNIHMKEYEVPTANRGDIVTEVEQANVCGSELHITSGNHPLIQSDMVLGHEGVCRISDMGKDVDTDHAGNPVEVGDRIVPVYFHTCQQCSCCQRGEFNLCQNSFNGWSKSPDKAPHFHGTFGTHYYIDEQQYFYRVPDNLESNVASIANCAVSQILFGLDKTNINYSDTIVIQGGGGLGLSAAAIAKERGATVILIEGSDKRLNRASEFGADYTIDFRQYSTVEQRSERVKSLNNGIGADVAIEVTGTPDAFAEGIDLLRTGGRYLEMGNITPGNITEFDVGKLTRSAINITSLNKYDPWYLNKSLDFLERNHDQYPFDTLLDARFQLSEFEQAIEKSSSRDVIRATLIP